MSVFLADFTPAKVYKNFYEDRAIIRQDHKGKVSGIYLFFNLQDITKCYVGQSINIVGRLNNYLNNAFLNGHKNSKSPFIKALLKHGQSNFYHHFRVCRIRQIVYLRYRARNLLD